jgi:hypothetical protein
MTPAGSPTGCRPVSMPSLTISRPGSSRRIASMAGRTAATYCSAVTRLGSFTRLKLRRSLGIPW